MILTEAMKSTTNGGNYEYRKSIKQNASLEKAFTDIICSQ
ncbi:hypothetical protein NEOC95_000752 [Neochlamydia sp. AcF95]|nr:hypothetical protein [Neochlamydia sp. AcF95]